ncbi:unnamed protein product [Rhizophagus irregularis]|nr:unnamed protein product [Rhizophagus irregularis]
MLQKSFSLYRSIFSVKSFSCIKKYSTAANQQQKPSAFMVFNRETKRIQRDRSSIDIEESRKVDYLKDEIAYRMVDRLISKENLIQSLIWVVDVVI